MSKARKKIQFSLSPCANMRMAGLEKDEVGVRVLACSRAAALQEPGSSRADSVPASHWFGQGGLADKIP